MPKLPPIVTHPRHWLLGPVQSAQLVAFADRIESENIRLHYVELVAPLLQQALPIDILIVR